MIFSEEELKKIHSVLMMMMEEIKRVCDENDIKYFLMWGTLIGAVRHKGFIPWDDDLDIAMPREDYEKFMKIADSRFKINMSVENYKISEGYGHCFGKVVLNGTSYEENFTEFANCKKGIYIDIFPMDITTSDESKRRRQGRISNIIKRLLLLNCNYKYTKTGVKAIIYKVGYIFASFFPKMRLVNLWEKNAFRFNNSDNGMLVLFSNNGIRYDIMACDKFDGYEEVPFENLYLKIPRQYDSILKKYYGDYMQLPPEEKRMGHHNIVKLDFGDYLK